MRFYQIRTYKKLSSDENEDTTLGDGRLGINGADLVLDLLERKTL